MSAVTSHFSVVMTGSVYCWKLDFGVHFCPETISV